MTQTQTSKRFLTVGSFLRPEDLLAYKRQIEERDDIQYPFYQDFGNYEKVEDEAVADIVKEIVRLQKQMANISRMASNSFEALTACVVHC